MNKLEKTALAWYCKFVHQFPAKDFNKITSEIKEYELMRNSFLLGVHYAEHHLTPAAQDKHSGMKEQKKCSFCGKLFDEKEIPGPPEMPPHCCKDEECRKEKTRWLSRITG